MTAEQFLDCCGSRVWAQNMFDRQPFPNSVAMHEAADQVWWSLSEADWLEAFAKHPRIGQTSNAKWSAQEQSGMASAAVVIEEELARLNVEYYSRFGFIYIVCATGKSADEMLDILRLRLKNSAEEEIRIAAAEQAKITHLRLDKLIAE